MAVDAPRTPLTMSYYYNSSYASVFKKMFYANAEYAPNEATITSSPVRDEISGTTLPSPSLPDSAQVVTNDNANPGAPRN